MCDYYALLLLAFFHSSVTVFICCFSFNGVKICFFCSVCLTDFSGVIYLTDELIQLMSRKE